MNKIIKRIWSFWWVGLLLIITPIIIMSRIPDTDTFFLMKTGEFIVENGTVPTINPFVIHEGFHIVVQQWLFDVITYGAYNVLGNMGLFLFVISAYAVSIIMLYKYLSLFSKNETAKGIIMLLSGLFYLTFAVARPTCISFILILTLLYCIEKFRRTGKVINLCILPILSLIQINIHSAMWPMMFVMLLPYIFPVSLLQKGDIKKLTKNWFNRNKYIFLTIPVMLAAGFINPNGIKGMTYVLNSYGSATNGLQIAELTAPSTDSIQGIAVIIIGAFLALYIYINKAKLFNADYDMHCELTRASMTCGVLILACMHYRNAWYLILGATPMILDVIGNVQIKFKKPKWLTTFRQIELTIICLILTGTLSWFALSISSFSTKTTKDTSYAPIAAADYLDQIETSEIRLYTEFNNGAYMEWRGYKVYIDARPELFQSKVNGKENIYTEYTNFIQGNITFENFLDKYNFTHLIVSKNTRFDVYLSLQEEYTPVVIGNGYILYELNKK